MSLRTILFCALGALVLYGLFTVGFPFLLALLLAILLEPVVQALIKYARFNRIAAAVTACTLFTGLLLGFIYLVGFKMVSELVQYLKKRPELLERGEIIHGKHIRQNAIFSLRRCRLRWLPTCSIGSRTAWSH